MDEKEDILKDAETSWEQKLAEQR
jgi:hypothetical protein